ncbi:hypothetical protein J6590_056894, partial [Homalodisca vitripennis]
DSQETKLATIMLSVRAKSTLKWQGLFLAASGDETSIAGPDRLQTRDRDGLPTGD